MGVRDGGWVMAGHIWAVDTYFKQNGRDGFFVGNHGNAGNIPRPSRGRTGGRVRIRALDYDEAANLYGWDGDEGERE